MKWFNPHVHHFACLCPHSPAINQKSSCDRGDNAVKTEIVCEDCCMRPLILGMAFIEILIPEKIAQSNWNIHNWWQILPLDFDMMELWRNQWIHLEYLASEQGFWAYCVKVFEAHINEKYFFCGNIWHVCVKKFCGGMLIKSVQSSYCSWHGTCI